jgi:hypothetical protein
MAIERDRTVATSAKVLTGRFDAEPITTLRRSRRSGPHAVFQWSM